MLANRHHGREPKKGCRNDAHAWGKRRRRRLPCPIDSLTPNFRQRIQSSERNTMTPDLASKSTLAAGPVGGKSLPSIPRRRPTRPTHRRHTIVTHRRPHLGRYHRNSERPDWPVPGKAVTLTERDTPCSRDHMSWTFNWRDKRGRNGLLRLSARALWAARTVCGGGSTRRAKSAHCTVALGLPRRGSGADRRGAAHLGGGTHMGLHP